MDSVKVSPCPRCGDEMDFDERDDAWFCPSCGFEFGDSEARE